LILLVGALGAAFATNFMGIRDIATNAFNAVVGLVSTFVAALQQTGDPIQAVAAVLRQAFGPQAAEGFVAFVARVMEVAGQVRSALEQIGAAVGPSLGALGTFVQGTILPGLMMLASWFVSQGIPAFLLFASQVQTALMPVMAGLQAVFAALLPVFAQIGTLIQNVLIAGLPIAAQMINGVFIPALQLLWQVVSTLVLPLMGALARLVGSVLGVALQAIGAVLRNVIAPALGLIAEHIVKDVLPQMQALANLITANVGPAIQWFVDNVLTPLQQALGFIIGLLESFSEWLNQIADQLANMQLPDWLQRHSPSPFEQTLMSANESLREMRRLAPDAFGAFPKANVVGMADALPSRGGINVAGIGLNIQNLNVNDRGHAETLGRAYAGEVMRILDDVNTRGRSWAAHGA